LQNGCSKLGPLLQNLNLDPAEGRATASTAAGDKLPDPSETQEIQGQLRAAGFDPGPVDGIFGSRTQFALRKFKGGCLMVKDFDGMLNDPLPAFAAETTSTRPAETSISSSKSEARVGVTHGAGGQEAAGVQLVQAREEVRILQLRLRDAGFDPGPFDGVMGPKTRSALAQYEASQGGRKIKTSSANQSVNAHY
jgi:peptidoglycan hydrolase-like protein with peptidoglycan-binding domain